MYHLHLFVQPSHYRLSRIQDSVQKHFLFPVEFIPIRTGNERIKYQFAWSI